MVHRNLLTGFLLTIFWLTSCTAAPAAGATPAAQAMESYLNALVNKDEAKISSLVCPDWEADALLEYDSFAAVQTKLDQLTCQQVQGEGNTAQVTCKGKILATYSNETQEFDLGQRTYQVIKQGDDWQVCGYTTP